MKVQRPDTPGPRPGWLLLFVAISIVLITVWYREGETGPLHRTKSAVQLAMAPVGSAGEWLTRPVRNVVFWATDLGVSRSQLEELRSQNERLRARVAELEESRLENERLNALLGVKPAASSEVLGAHVIGRPMSSWEGVMTIDRGSADGVQTGMPVLGPLGLLGQTIEVSPNSAKVRLITDQRSGVAAMIQSTRAEGVVRGSIDGRLWMDFVSVDSTVTAGDVVITSGLGGVFPKGTIIGEVVEVRTSPSALQQEIRVVPASEPSKLEEVVVLLGKTPLTEPEDGE